jgi:hypothetical protein
VTGRVGASSFDFGVRVTDAAGGSSATVLHVDVAPFFPLVNAKGNVVTDDFAAAPESKRRFIELLAGTRLDGTFRLLGKGALGAHLRFVDAVTGEEIDLTGHLKVKGTKATLSGLTMTATRRLYVIVDADPDFTGRIETNLRALAQTSWKGTVALDPLQLAPRVTIAAKVGSTVTVTIVRAKKSHAQPTIRSLVDALGNQLVTDGELKLTKTGAILKLSQALPAGNVTITFAPVQGTLPGMCNWTAKLKGASGYDVKLLDLAAGDPETP